jgi:hypothetical protein
MKKFVWILAVVVALVIASTPAAAQCVTIQSGLLLYQPGHYLAGQPITTGVNPYGYNYQARSFNGNYFNVYAGGGGLPAYDGNDAAYLAANPSAAGHWAWPYRYDDVAMKWNDAWISTKDCDGDGRLDRHFGFVSYTGSDAWLTNHNSWTVLNPKGREVQASEFIKIMANPVNAVIGAPISYFLEQTVYLNGKVMGPQIWGEFAVIQYVLNNPSTGDNGLKLKSEVAAGFGFYKQ